MGSIVPSPAAVTQILPSLEGVQNTPGLERGASLFAQGQEAEWLILIDSGLAKLTRLNGASERIILAIFGPGQVLGEEALESDTSVYYANAEALTRCTVTRVPRNVLTKAVSTNPELALSLTLSVLSQKRKLAEKVELLCLHNVEFRVLHYLAELANLVAPGTNGDGHQLPITQMEFADLIGATRETTSTTLNQLERRGLVKLSRRLLTVDSPDKLREAASSIATQAK
jgi:CRP-like cAMP-binding protein